MTRTSVGNILQSYEIIRPHRILTFIYEQLAAILLAIVANQFQREENICILGTNVIMKV